MAEYGGFNFGEVILKSREDARRSAIDVATQAVKNQQFEKEMTLRKSQLNERIRSNKAVEDYRDRTLSQADEHFEENLAQRQTEFSEKHDLDERTHEYFKDISNRGQDFSEDQFAQQKREFEVTTGYNYDKLAQDWEKHRTALEEGSRQFDEGLNENQRQFDKNYKQRRKEFKERHKLNEAQFKELRRMNKFKRTMSKAEFEEQINQFETTTGYKYDVLAQDLVKFDESMTQDLYRYNRTQTFEETRFRKKHNLDIAQFSELRRMNEFKETMTKAEFAEQTRQFEKTTGYKYDVLSQDLMKFDMGMDQDLYKYDRSQGFEEYKYQDIQSQTRVNAGLLPETALPEDYGTDVGFFEGAARIGASAFTGGTLTAGITTGLSGGAGALISPITFGAGFVGGGVLAAADLAFGSEGADRGALKQSEAFMTEVENLAPRIASRPQNQAVIANQMAELDQSLSDAQQTLRVKKLRKRIAALENKITIPAVYNSKSMLSK